MFPLCQRPGSLAVLDDDPIFLTVLQAQLSTRWNVRGFEHAEELLAVLALDEPFWEVDVWLQHELVENWRSGTCTLARGVVNYWRRQTERFACTRVCLIDYRLQDCNGLDVLRSVGSWKGRKVLVTGVPDAGLRERATSSGLIDGFLSKSGARMLPRLVDLVERYQAEPDPRLQCLWSETLSSEQLAALAGAGVAESVRALAGSDLMEYVVLSEPFGILGLDGHGALRWLPLSMAAAGQVVSDTELRKALDLPAEDGQHAPARALGNSGLSGALFKIPPRPDLELPIGYEGWLSRQQLSRSENAIATRESDDDSSAGRNTAWCRVEGGSRTSAMSGVRGC